MRMRFVWRALKARYLEQRAELSAIHAAIQADGIAIDIGVHKGCFIFQKTKVE